MSDSNNIAKIYLKRINHHIKGKELEQELFKACSNIIYCILNKERSMRIHTLIFLHYLKCQN